MFLFYWVRIKIWNLNTDEFFIRILNVERWHNPTLIIHGADNSFPFCFSHFQRPNIWENKAVTLVSHQIEMLSCLCYMWHIKLVVPNFRWYENMLENLKCRFPVPTYKVNLVGLEWGPRIWVLTPFSHFILCKWSWYKLVHEPRF